MLHGNNKLMQDIAVCNIELAEMSLQNFRVVKTIQENTWYKAKNEKEDHLHFSNKEENRGHLKTKQKQTKKHGFIFIIKK